MINTIKNIFSNFIDLIFRNNKILKLGLYGAPNSGKTTLANRICKDLLNNDDEFGEVSSIAHETRNIKVKEELYVNKKGRKIKFDLIDTPGIATRIDYEHFVKAGLNNKEAKQRAKEATKGVIEAIKWLDSVEVVVIVIDSTKNPYNQVNLTIIGNLEARKIPFMLVANKIDLKSSRMEKIEKGFPKYRIIGISAKFCQNMDEFYEAIIDVHKNHKSKKQAK